MQQSPAGVGEHLDQSGLGAVAGDRRLPPPPEPGAPTPLYHAAWVAYAAHDALVVVREERERARGGGDHCVLYAVDEATGLLDCGELMTRCRVKAAELYLDSCRRLGRKDFTRSAAHACELWDARSASGIAANAFASREKYPQVWAGIPFITSGDLDADLSVICTPSGVWSIPECRILSPEEAREKFAPVKIRWDYDPEVSHTVALKLFDSLYGDLEDTMTMEFARWRQAATALVRKPDGEIIVKISKTGSAKSTEGNLQLNAFWPLVFEGERAAIVASSGYSSGRPRHNSCLADPVRPARRVNVAGAAAYCGRRQRALDSQLLHTLSEGSAITYRNPGAHPHQTVPCDAHLFIEGDWPRQGGTCSPSRPSVPTLPRWSGAGCGSRPTFRYRKTSGGPSSAPMATRQVALHPRRRLISRPSTRPSSR